MARVRPVTVTCDPRQDALEPTFDPGGGGIRRGLHWEGGRRAQVRAALGRLY